MKTEVDALAALRELVRVIDAAGLHNLSNGVQLGPTVWYVKAHDAMESARAVLASDRGLGISAESADEASAPAS